MTESLLVSRDAGVLALTINRPARGNSLDPATIDAMRAEIEPLQADGGPVRAVLLSSTGKHFCTGADISGAREGGAGGSEGRPDGPVGHVLRSVSATANRLIRAVWDCPLPTVAVLTGRTSGLGLHLALTCDVTVAASSATFAEPFSDRGFNVDSGGSWLLPRFAGLTRAKRLLYTSEVIDAHTALDWGLVSEVRADDEVLEAAHAAARGLAARPTLAIAAMKRLLHRGLTGRLEDAMHDELLEVELTIRSDDFKEGISAFLDKRDPEFRGR